MSSTCTVTATLNDPGNNELTNNTNAFVRFRLRNFQGYIPQVQGTAVVCETKIDALPNGSGQISQTLFQNNAITPENTFYTVEYWSQGRITSSGNYIFNGNTDLDTAAQINAPPAPPGFELVLQNNGQDNSKQDFLNLESIDSSITITDEGSGTINLAANVAGAPNAAFMVGAGHFELGDLSLATGSLDDTALRVYTSLFNTPFGLSFNKFYLWAGSGLGGGGDFACALYSSSGNLLWTSPTTHVPNTAGEAFSVSLSGFPTLAPGSYYFAWTANGSSGGGGGVNGLGWDISAITATYSYINLPGIVGYSSTLATESGSVGSGTISFPSSLGALNTITATIYLPAVIFT